MHLPHVPVEVPVRKQYGASDFVHALGTLSPRSPPQGAQVSGPTTHTGVAPVHAASSAGVHWTQASLAGSQTGCEPPHCVSIKHSTQVPWFGPIVAHTSD